MIHLLEDIKMYELERREYDQSLKFYVIHYATNVSIG